MMLVVRGGLLIYLIFSVFSCRLGENDTIIKGKVIDSSDSPIENVTVLLKNKDSLEYPEHYIQGALSDKNGKFKLEIKGELSDFVLYVGKIRYKELIIKNIKLKLKDHEVVLLEDNSEHIDYIPKN
ncbi:carboxypeptidase-like regulatory domain-containing protein [Flagellimonas crocea]|uniref:carboxypeptidase-like regulatory domain-containing protein n=1 Tax=Flagellimonas crocea TaxID=3067311 RepID=UPI00296FF393|nr:carboxypeptidase-like regulatory domain-containing protein [Muricauda sp. DH64]